MITHSSSSPAERHIGRRLLGKMAGGNQKKKEAIIKKEIEQVADCDLDNDHCGGNG